MATHTLVLLEGVVAAAHSGQAQAAQPVFARASQAGDLRAISKILIPLTHARALATTFFSVAPTSVCIHHHPPPIGRPRIGVCGGRAAPGTGETLTLSHSLRSATGWLC